MDVPAAILEVLKCSRCEKYLSRGPVFLQHDGAASCGQCCAPERPATRNIQYEATARMLKFPCKYRELGCLETVPFAEEQQEIAHEEVCEHRQYVCPVLGSAACDWLGTRQDFLQHCNEQHPDKVVGNPTTLVHDISKTSVQTYLLRAFEILFLLHTKVCLVSGKIFHAVRLLGASGEASSFEFTVDIKRGIDQLTKTGQVAPQGCRAIQEDSSLALTTNSLLDVLGGFDGATFTVTVKRKVDMVPCAECQAEVTVFRYRDEDGWRCDRCAPRRACMYQGCNHIDIDMKSLKHERYFCQQRTMCGICLMAVRRGTWAAHYRSKHQDITHSAGSTWRTTQTKRWLLSSVAGTAVCLYTPNDKMFDLQVFIPVPSERLREFRCVVRVTDPATGHALWSVPFTLYSQTCDWHIIVRKEDFQSWNTHFDVSVDIKQSES